MTFPVSSAESALVERVRRNLDDLVRRIADVGRDPATVRIVAVTKTFGLDAVRAAAHVGLTHVGENYVDELATKREALGDLELQWHYLGALQTNKIARVARHADYVSGVSRRREIDALAKCPAVPRLHVQLDVTGRDERNGAPIADVPDLVSYARARGLDVRGLMVVAPPEPEGARAAFRALRALADELDLPERSMGMSDDLELALACGGTEVRVGRSLFGERKTPHGRALT